MTSTLPNKEPDFVRGCLACPTGTKSISGRICLSTEPVADKLIQSKTRKTFAYVTRLFRMQ